MLKLRNHIKKQRYHLVNKGPSSQSYGLFSGHVWMWELDYKESWMPKNWCFWSVVLEKILESPLDSREIQPVHSKGNQSWIFIGRTVAEAETETPILWPPDAKKLIWKDPVAWKDWKQESKGTTEDEIVGWHHQLKGHDFEQALRDEEKITDVLQTMSSQSWTLLNKTNIFLLYRQQILTQFCKAN